MIYYVTVFTGVTIASFSQILLKSSTKVKYKHWIREYLNVRVICGYAMIFLAMACSIYSYSGLEYTNVPLLESSAYIMVMILSYFFFKEKITRRKLLGVAVILWGVFSDHLEGSGGR
jgi:drug/metabolite transporter (DMT)-like permease